MSTPVWYAWQRLRSKKKKAAENDVHLLRLTLINMIFRPYQPRSRGYYFFCLSFLLQYLAPFSFSFWVKAADSASTRASSSGEAKA